METDQTEPAPSNAPDDLTGVVLSERYRLVERIGEGGMGVIYRAEHIHMRKDFAVKVLHPLMTTIDEAVQRFEREAQAAANIEHPNVCAATDFGRAENGAFFLVMEYLEGETLKDVLDRDGSVAIVRALKICRQICAALRQAHELGIVHRDLKPENVLLIERDGDPDVVKVLDFGIARVPLPQEDGTVKTLTKAGTVMGTPAYVSPEQAAGAQTDHRTDIYSLGVCLFEMVAGRRPFESDSIVELMGMHVTKPAPRLRDLATSAVVPRRLDKLVDRMLAKEPEGRPDGADAVCLEMDAIEASMADREASVSVKLRELLSSSRDVLVGSDDSSEGRGASLRDLPLGAWALIAVHLAFSVTLISLAVSFGLGGGDEPVRTTAAEPSEADGGVEPQPPSPLDEARERPEVQRALKVWKTHGPVVAARRLGDLYEHAPNPELAYLLASAESETDQRHDALRHTRAALDGNPELAKAADLRPFVLGELGGRYGWLAFEIIQEHYFPYVVPELEALACASEWTQGQKRAQGLLAQAKALDRVEPWCKLSIELDLASSCRTRKAIIGSIRELGDPRALPALRRVNTRRRGWRRRNNGCLIEELRAARRELGGEDGDEEPDSS